MSGRDPASLAWLLRQLRRGRRCGASEGAAAVTRIPAIAIVLLAATTTPLQGQAGNPLSAGAKRTYGIIKGYITRAAAKMPEEDYAFKPTPDVRSFGQIVGHITDENYGFCAAAAGEKPPVGGFEPGAVSIEKTKTAKADLE